jgi:hypothetical protein
MPVGEVDHNKQWLMFILTPTGLLVLDLDLDTHIMDTDTVTLITAMAMVGDTLITAGAILIMDMVGATLDMVAA